MRLLYKNFSINSEILLSIVQSWNICEKPKYRGFRCGYCQKPLYKAWHHWCKVGGYLTPVHLCNNCELLFNCSKARIIKLKKFRNKKNFGLEILKQVKEKLEQIIKHWNTQSKPVYKTFTCDGCGRNIHKAYHFWFKKNETLSEIHLCKKCGDELQFNISK
jgi:RNase P subunit RPR2